LLKRCRWQPHRFGELRRFSDFMGSYADPAYGVISFTLRDGWTFYQWGDLYGAVEIYDRRKGR
jgi:hypothetical protein